jgi:ribosome recycling factor
MTSSPLLQLSFLSELCVQNMFNFVRNSKATSHLSVVKVEKFSSCTVLNTAICSLTELLHMVLIVIYKFSVISAVSEEIRKFNLNVNNFVYSWPAVLEEKLPTDS